MNFEELFEKVLLESYSFSKDKELQLYDFYMLFFLIGAPIKNVVPTRIDIDALIQELVHEMIPPLREEMLRVLTTAIYSSFFGLQFYAIPESLSEIRKIIKKYGLEKYKMEDDPVIEKEDRLNLALATTELLKKKFKDQGFIEDNDEIRRRWILITEAFPKLYNARTVTDLFLYIDHVYDLQHWGGSIFEYSDDFYKDHSIKWVYEALEFKRDINDKPWELYERCSYSMKSVARQILYAKGYGTEEHHF